LHALPFNSFWVVDANHQAAQTGRRVYRTDGSASRLSTLYSLVVVDLAAWILRSGFCVVDLAKDPLPSHRFVPQGLPTVPLKSSTARSSRPSDLHEEIATVSTSRKRFSATTGRGTFPPADTDGPKRDLTPFSSPVLEADSLCKSYAIGEVLTPALLDVSLAVQPASFVSIMGPSGCGKSTLLHLLGGLDRADSGDVRLEGMSLAQMDETERTLLRRRRIGFVFQKVHLLPMLTALENVLVPLRLDGLHTEVARERAMQALESVAMSHRAGHRPGELSGGEAQRVAIARALVIQPAVLLADEPTGSLDSANSSRIIQLFQQLVAELKHSLIVVTHDANVADAAERRIRMMDGRIVSDQTSPTSEPATVMGDEVH
jgi:putative ABC transport system ATP-binding protein